MRWERELARNCALCLRAQPPPYPRLLGLGALRVRYGTKRNARRSRHAYSKLHGASCLASRRVTIRAWASKARLAIERLRQSTSLAISSTSYARARRSLRFPCRWLAGRRDIFREHARGVLVDRMLCVEPWCPCDSAWKRTSGQATMSARYAHFRRVSDRQLESRS